MASSASISGLVSGLDTASIIDQLMQLEAQPQAQLKTRVSSEQSLVTTLQTINTKAALMGSKAGALSTAASWQAVTATSSSSAVSVTAASTAAPARFSVTVTSVARTHQLGFANAAALTDHVTGATNKVVLDRFDGSPVQLDTGDGTLKGLADAINDPANATGLRATTIKTENGYRLLVESTATGAAQDFTLTAEDGSALLGGATVRAGTDTSIDLGSGITVSSTSNTFTDLVPGMSLTLSADAAVGSVSTVEVKRDVSKLSAGVADMVASMNALLKEIDTQTAYDSSSGKSGPLAGDTTVRNLRSAVLNSIFSSDGKSLASVGIQTDKDGNVVFDSTKFASAYAADPVGTAAMFTSTTDPANNGFAARVQAVSKGASDPSTGTLTSALTARRSGIDRMQKDIDNWDTRLELRRATLQQQFTALETAMSQMQSQSSWLAGQISSLPSYSS